MNFKNIKKTFVVAEIGVNHEGNINLAKRMINLASKAGVDAVKFQTFIPEHYVSSEDQSRLKKLREFQLNHNQFNELSKFARKKGLIFFSTPFDLKSAKFLNKIQSIFKISSGDNNFYPLIDVCTFHKVLRALTFVWRIFCHRLHMYILCLSLIDVCSSLLL